MGNAGKDTDLPGFYAITYDESTDNPDWVSAIYYFNGEKFTDELIMLSAYDWRNPGKVRYKTPKEYNACKYNQDTPMLYLGE